MKNLMRILNRERPLIDVWHYLVGNYRYKLYYSHRLNSKLHITGKLVKHPLMRQHIWEQITWRIKVMNRECYYAGSCKICGCATTELQMCNKSCDGKCYPPMMSKNLWGLFKQTKQYKDVQTNNL